MNLEAFLVQWIKSGLIAWAVWLIVSMVYIAAATKCDLVKINRIREDEDEEETDFRKLQLMYKLVVVLRTIIWPWGLVDRSVAVVREVERVL
jgi:hypothetical protein